MSTASNVPLAPRHADEDVWSYPRPPLLQRVPRSAPALLPACVELMIGRLRVIWVGLDGKETVLVDCPPGEGLRVCETTHPPTYYLPPSTVLLPLTKTSRSTFCEWKGSAAYHSLTPPRSSGTPSKPIENRIWSYPHPNTAFAPLEDYLSFYASTGRKKEQAGGEWKCYVDDEEVGVQEGDFYGGWVTRNIKGKMKGGPGTWGW